MRVAGEFFLKSVGCGCAGIAAGAGDIILRLVSNSLLLVYNLLDCKRHTDNSCCNSDDDSDDFDYLLGLVHGFTSCSNFNNYDYTPNIRKSQTIPKKINK